MKIKIFAALLFSLISLPTLAQMISQTAVNHQFFSGNIGQSFVATATTQITQINVHPVSNYTGTLYIYHGNAGSGTVGAVGAPAYTQTGINLAASAIGGPMRAMVLATPFAVTAGNSYTFILDGFVGLYADSSDPYAGGQFIPDYADQLLSGYDLAFEILAAGPAAAATPAAIPTLGEWALIFMSGLLAMLGLMSVRRGKAGKSSTA
jgi:hypothetical protein